MFRVPFTVMQDQPLKPCGMVHCSSAEAALAWGKTERDAC